MANTQPRQHLYFRGTPKLDYNDWLKQTNLTFHSRSSELQQIDKWLCRYMECKTYSNLSQLAGAFNNWKAKHPDSSRNQDAFNDLKAFIEFESSHSTADRNIDQIAVGPDLYLFRAGRYTDPSVPRGLIISSHGGGTLTHSHFTAPANLHFFVEDNVSLNDPGIRAVMNHDVLARGDQTVWKGQTCKDYLLDKFQTHFGSTKNGESYQTILRSMNALRERQLYFRQTGDLNALTSDNRFNLYKQYDVCTIRNRSVTQGSFHVKLSSVLNDLAAHGYVYNDVYCSFCRTSFSNCLLDALPFYEAPSASAHRHPLHHRV